MKNLLAHLPRLTLSIRPSLKSEAKKIRLSVLMAEIETTKQELHGGGILYRTPKGMI